MADVKLGIKEILELLEGLKVLSVDGKKLVENGQNVLADLPILLSLLTNFKVLSAAVQGVDQIIPEGKDLDVGEAEQIVAKVLEIVAAVKAA